MQGVPECSRTRCETCLDLRFGAVPQHESTLMTEQLHLEPMEDGEEMEEMDLMNPDAAGASPGVTVPASIVAGLRIRLAQH